MKNISRIFNHAVRMINKNVRSYLMLSITMFLSFLLVLSILVYMDTSLYNENKVLFSLPSNIGQITESNSNKSEAKVLLRYIDTVENTTISSWKETSTFLPTYSSTNVNVMGQIYFMPYYQQKLPYFDGSIFRLINIREGDYFSVDDVNLNNNVALVGSSFASRKEGSLLGSYIKIPVIINDVHVIKDFRIVGIFEDDEDSVYYDRVQKNSTLFTKIIVPYSNYTSFDKEDLVDNHTIVSDELDAISEQAINVKAGITSISSRKKDAYFKLYNNAMNKGVILFIVFLILGLSSYSNMTNSLQNRKQEIGIKLALGIEKRYIFMEFFLEALIVLFINIVLAIVVFTSLASIYLMWMRMFVDETFILHVSFSSMLQFLVFAFFIVNISSAILAHQATRVNALKHIRNE